MQESYLLQREQLIARPIDEVFAFFADARNLEAITPPWLGFQILPPEPTTIQTGTHINYRIRWHGLPLRWVTEIRSWNPPTEFADVQIKGPYRLWHHTHTFQTVDGGTLMTDLVRYILPLGFLGRLAHRWKVEADLNTIFDFRARTIADILSAGRGSPAPIAKNKDV